MNGATLTTDSEHRAATAGGGPAASGFTYNDVAGDSHIVSAKAGFGG